MYVATNNEVFAFNVLHQDKETCTKIDDIGCDIGKNYAKKDVYLYTNYNKPCDHFLKFIEPFKKIYEKNCTNFTKG